MTRVLVLTPDVLRARMAGPAMRAWHIAQRLAEEHEVRLLTTSPYCEVSSAGFVVAAVGPDGLAEAEAWCDVMILQGYVMYHHPVLAMSQKIIVFDIYSPLHLETLALTKGTSSEARDAHVRLSIETLNHQLERGDFLICASERQRDLFIGQLCAVGRANALTYDPDPTLRRLIDVVPFGLPDDDAEHREPALRGVVPGIGPDDDLLIWAGGVYDWFDPLTLIRAVAGASKKRPSVRLYFMGLQHPNPDVPPMQMAIDAKALAEELGVAGKHVFFNDGWVEYSERQNYLLEATLGVSTHFESLETRFSFRTRALDYLWAGLPIVAPQGDSFGQLIEEAGFPAGVVNIVNGLGETTGAALVRHSGVDKISFTGSYEVGRVIGKVAAESFKRVTLELGGKSPQIIFADANLEAAIKGTAMGVFANQGQVCAAGTRILVERPVYDQVVEALGGAAQSVRLGNPLDPETQMGALINKQQLERVLDYIRAGKEEGAKLVAGGERSGERGYFVQPTIFADASNDMRIAREEIFGPVGTVIPFDGPDEAERIANDSFYGLAATIWTQDISKAHTLAAKVRAGTVWINGWGAIDPRLPWGGVKGSGVGRELGWAGIEANTEEKVVTVVL